MARVSCIDRDQFPAELQEMTSGGDSHGTDGVWATRPELMIPYRQFSKALTTHSLLPKRLVELVRLRIAYHNQCRSCMARRSKGAIDDGLTEELVCQLARPEDGQDLTERERAALHYADLLATDHLAIGDETFDRLHRLFSDPEVVELGIYCALFVGFGRVAMSWDLVDALPERFKQRDATITPWRVTE